MCASPETLLHECLLLSVKVAVASGMDCASARIRIHSEIEDVSLTRVSASALAEHFSVSTRQINRQISLGMPTSSLADAAFWRANRPESQCARNLEASAIGRRSPCQRNGNGTTSQLVKSAPVVARRHVENFCSRHSGVEEDAF